MKNIEQFLTLIPVLSENTVHVFLLELNSFDYQDCIKNLSVDECNRAGKLKIESKRNQFVITRSLLRQFLALSLNKSPQDIHFCYAQHCKPYIEDQYNNNSLEFNVSHSGAYAVIAISLNNKLGVDIEQINTKADYNSLSNRFFSQQEKEQYSKLAENEQLELFYRIWVRKESFTKAIGKGVSFGLDQFSVSLDKKCSVSEIITSKKIKEKWFCTDINSPANYKAALTVNRDNIEIKVTDLTG